MEFLMKGVIVTPGTETQTQYMMNLSNITAEMQKPGNKIRLVQQQEKKSFLGNLLGGGHGHSHGGKPCHGHGGEAAAGAAGASYGHAH
jgi:hypothetical protein